MTATSDTAQWTRRRYLLSAPRVMTVVVALVALASYASGAFVMSVQDDEPLFADPARSAATGLGYRTELLEGLVPGVETRLMWQPPGYPLLLSGWSRVFGFGLIEGRMLSALACALALAILYLLARSRASQAASVVAVLLVAVTPWFAGAATTIRPDAVAVLAVVLTAFLLDRHLRDESRRLHAAIGVTATVAVLMHPLGFIAPALVSIALAATRRWLPAIVHVLAVAALASAIWIPFVCDQWDLFASQMQLQGERKPPFNPLALLHSEKRLIGFAPLASAIVTLIAQRAWGRLPSNDVIGVVIALVAATVGAENQYPAYLVVLGAPLVATAVDASAPIKLWKASLVTAAIVMASAPAFTGLVQSTLSSSEVRAVADQVRPSDAVFLGPGGGGLYFELHPARLRMFSPVPPSADAAIRILGEQDLLIASLPPPTSPYEVARMAEAAQLVSGSKMIGVWRVSAR